MSNHPTNPWDVQKTASLKKNNNWVYPPAKTDAVSISNGWADLKIHTKIVIWSCLRRTGRKTTKKKRKEKEFLECMNCVYTKIYHFSNMWASWLNYCIANKFILPSAVLGKWQPAHPCKSSSVGAHLLGEVSAGSRLVEATEPGNWSRNFCSRSLEGKPCADEYTLKKTLILYCIDAQDQTRATCKKDIIWVHYVA